MLRTSSIHGSNPGSNHGQTPGPTHGQTDGPCGVRQGALILDPSEIRADQLDRIAVIGSSGSGKSTLAKKISTSLGHRHVELDALYWLPDWQERSVDGFRALVSEATAGQHWVSDGNYTRKVTDVIWPRATLIVWLDFSLPRTFGQLLKRTLTRSLFASELWNGNRESLTRSFLHKDSVLLYLLRSHARNRQKLSTLIEANGVTAVRLTKPAETELFLRRALDLKQRCRDLQQQRPDPEQHRF